MGAGHQKVRSKPLLYVCNKDIESLICSFCLLLLLCNWSTYLSFCIPLDSRRFPHQPIYGIFEFQPDWYVPH